LKKAFPVPLTALGFWCLATAGLVSAADVKIAAVYFDTFLSGEPEEAVQLINTGSGAADISLWSMDDGGASAIVFPSGTILAPGARLWVTDEGAAFTEQFGEMPDFETSETDAGIPNVAGNWPGFANAGDEVFLRDSGGALLDLVVYGTSAYAGPGWAGPPVVLDEDLWGGVEGQILERDRLEDQPGVVPDTDTAADFDDHRVWDVGASHFLAASFTAETTALAAAVPDNNYQAFVDALDGAKSSLLINVYEFTNTYLAEKIVDALGRGVSVTVLLEGGPVGGISDQERWIAKRIEDNGGAVYFIINDSDAGIHDRYQYDHAKYTIVDGETLIIGSENYGQTGHPNDPSYGNRGWEVHLRDASVAAWFTAVFNDDLDLAHNDIRRYFASDPVYGAPPPAFVPDTDIPSGSYSPQQPAQSFTGTMTVEPVISPDISLMENHGILNLLNTASGTLELEFLQMPTWWGPESGSPSTTPNLILEAVIEAARRGVAVRVLLDSNWFNTDPNDPRDNDDTVAYLNAVAAAESLPIEARLINLGATALEKIHNKGITISNGKTLISSINGSENSFKRNREAGLIIDYAPVAAYYVAIFDYDWTLSGPGAGGPGPGSVVINEVAWMGTQANALDEWLELYNTTCQAVDLTGWYILDDGGSQTYTIVSGIVPPHGYFLVEDAQAATSEPADAVLNLSLANTGDSLQLFDSAGALVDTVNGPGGAWYVGGNSGSKPSMERRDACSAMDAAANWGSNDGLTQNGTDALGNAVSGTPRRPNSVQADSCPSCGGQVAAEPMITEVRLEAGGVRLFWSDASADPAFNHYHLYRSVDPSSEGTWTQIGGEIGATEYLDTDSGGPYYYLPVAVGLLPDGQEREGPSGHYDGYFDR
jgi:phosphatidylserine/phosphatidylglycerophosphate/cardiolipin synthase-like enzyme